MSFGFSVGDFVAALQLVGKAINALRESGGSGSEYRELVNELYSLELALLRVKQLELEEEQRSEYTALRQAAAQCQQTIDAFWTKTQTYQKHMRIDGTDSTLKSGWKKLKWAMCKSEDVVRFKHDIAAHTQSIQILLASLQMSNSTLQDRKRDKQYRTLAATIQDATNSFMSKLSEMTASISSSASVGLQILNRTTKILYTNILIFQMVCNIQNIVTRIPNQIDRQEPVFMIDAIGRAAPFYLEFIRSSEALKAVLKLNFEKIPSGARKIDNNDFLIQDVATKRPIDLSRDWDFCFLPGQRVEMSMIFQWRSRDIHSCPNCKCSCQTRMDKETECPQCGMMFRRIVTIEDPPTTSAMAPRKTMVKGHTVAMQYTSEAPGPTTAPRPIVTAYDEADDMRHYRRIKLLHRQRRPAWVQPYPSQPSDIPDVHIQPSAVHEQTESLPSSSYYDIDSDEDTAFDYGDAVDPETFEQILDMDDDDDERDFSRSIVLDFFEVIETSMVKLHSAIQKCDLESVRGHCHHLKGRCATIGVEKLKETFIDLQDYQRPLADTDAEVCAYLTSRATEAYAEYMKAKTVLKTFYGMKN